MKHNHRPKTDTLSDIHEYKDVTKNRLILSMVVSAREVGSLEQTQSNGYAKRVSS